MTISEFSNEFDILYNNIMSNQAPGLDEYEKSVFLTKAQDEIVKAYFNSSLNKSQQGFDDNERRQIDFSMLMRVIRPDSVSSSYGIYSSNTGHKYYKMPKDILLYINETLIVTRGSNSGVPLIIIPISYTEYNRLMAKPYKRPTKNQAWRLISTGGATQYTYTDYEGMAANLADTYDINTATVFQSINGKTIEVTSEHYVKVGNDYLSTTGKLTLDSTEALVLLDDRDVTDYLDVTVPNSETVVEIIAGPEDAFGANAYTVRYVARPTPIILADLSSENVSINGQTAAMNCQLDPIMHHEVLQRAVELAKAAYTGDLSSQIALGQTSETNMGVVAQQK